MVGANYIQFAIAGITAIPGNSVLFKIKGTVSSTLPIGTMSTLTFESLLLNEGQPLPLIQNGSVKSVAAAVTYLFTGNGNWSVASNWSNNLIPPSTISNQDEIVIDPTGTGECVLNVNRTVTTNARIVMKAGKKLRVLGSVNIVR